MSIERAQNDRELVELARAGDVNAFTELVRLHQARVFAVALSYAGDRGLAEDATQEAFVLGWQKLAELSDPDAVSPWLCGIARNLSRKLGARGRRERPGDEAVVSEGTEEETPLHQLMEQEAGASLWALVERIPTRYREAMLLHYSGEQSVAEIAQCLGLSEAAVKKRLSRGRDMMRDRAERFSELARACRAPATLAVAVAALVSAGSASAKTVATSGSITTLIAQGLVVKKILIPAIALLLCFGSWFAYRGLTGDDAKDEAIAEVVAPRPAQRKARAFDTSPKPLAQISGTVIDAEGEPIAEARVVALRGGQTDIRTKVLEIGKAPRVAISDAEGRWALEVAPGAYGLQASARGYTGGKATQLSLAPAAEKEGVTIVLAAGGTRVHGIVSDIGGGPVVGALVAIESDVMLAHHRRGSVAAPSASDGSYEIWVAPGQYAIQVQHEGYSLHAEELMVTSEELEHDIGLVPGSVVEGVVVAGESREPVAGAVVIAGSAEDVRSSGAVSDEAGRFRLVGMPAGRSYLRASADHLAMANPEVLELGIGENQVVELVLDVGYNVRGIVLDAKGQPVAGADVELGELSGNSLPALEPTDQKGRFEIAGVPSGNYALAAEHPEHPAALVLNGAQIEQEDLDDLVVRFRPGQRIKGQVTPASAATLKVSIGDDVAGATALMSGNFDTLANAMAATTRAEADGSFVLPMLPEGPYTLIAIADDGRRGISPFEISSEAPAPLEVALRETRTITGTLVHADGSGAASVPIAVRSADLAFDQVGGRTDKSGRYTISGMFLGAFEVEIRDAGCRRTLIVDGERRKVKGWTWTIEHDQHGILDGSGTTDLGTQTVSSCRSSLSGRVLDARREPVADAWVTVLDSDFRSRPVLTDSEGNFAVHQLPDDVDLIVEVAHPIHGSAHKTEVRAGSELEIALNTSAGLRLAVTYQGDPVPSYQLTLRGPVTQERSVRNPGGAIRLGQVPAGSYDVIVVADEGQVKGSLVVEAGATQPVKEIELIKWTTVRGRALYADGSPIANRALVAVDPAWSRDSEVAAFTSLMLAPKTDADGRFELKRVPAGSTGLLSLGGQRSLAAGMQVSPGTENDLGDVTFVEFDINE